MTGLPVTEHSYHPQIFDTRSAAGRDAVDTLCTTPGVMVIDGIAAQRESLGRLIPAPDAELLDEPSRWVHYPWRRTVVHLLGPKAFRRLRLDRNRNMITAVEQTRLDRLRVGVVGLSVGHVIAHTLAAEGLAGSLVAAFVRWWFMTRAARPFRKCDFWGLSYYAFVPFAPFPLDVLNNRAELEKRHIPHDNLWGYKPEGLGPVLRRFAKKYGKPIVITENGLCTDDPQQRIRAIRDYLKVCREAIDDGVNLLGYIHWSTWDNFEWHLGPTFRFGLVRVDFRTMERSMTPAGLFYEKVVRENGLEV